MIEACGLLGGKVTFDGRFVEISKTGAAAFANPSGIKRIPVRSIAAIQLKPAGLFTRGFIQFTVEGGNERTARHGHATVDAARDENSVIFTRKQQGAFGALQRAIEGAIYSR